MPLFDAYQGSAGLGAIGVVEEGRITFGLHMGLLQPLR
jgi:hypothetical protein